MSSCPAVHQDRVIGALVITKLPTYNVGFDKLCQEYHLCPTLLPMSSKHSQYMVPMLTSLQNGPPKSSPPVLHSFVVLVSHIESGLPMN